MRSLRYFALAVSDDGATQHFAGPYPTEDAAHTSLTKSLQADVDKGVAFTSAGVFSAEFHATPIPQKTAAPAKEDK